MQDFEAQLKKVWDTLEKMSEERQKEVVAAAEERRRMTAAADEERRRMAAAADEDRRKAAEERDRMAAAADEERRRMAVEADEDRRKAAEERDRMAAEAAEERRRMAAEADADRRKAAEERDRMAAEFDREMSKISRQLGGFTNNYGESLEEEFFRAIEDEMRLGDIPLHEVRRNIRNRYEYDIVGVNGECVAVGEIKRKLLPQDVAAFAEERLPHFAEDFPGMAANRKVLGMVGGELIVDDAQEEAEKRGLLLLRLKNKKLVVDNADGARPVSQTGRAE